MDETTELYQNTGYSFDRIQRRTLVLDVAIGDGVDVGLGKTFDETLQEPLIIDKLSDIYLDNFTTYDALPTTGGSSLSSFLIGIDQLNIKTATNNAIFKDKVSIPNESTGDNAHKVHKGKKYNFICTINPTVLAKLSGTITNIAATPAVAFDGDGRFILELLIISRDI